jgi:outer membrane immunogenic protein
VTILELSAMSFRAIILASLVAASSLVLPAAAADANLGWGGSQTTANNNFFSPSSAYNWSGFYAGVSGGYGWGAVRQTPPGGGTTETNASGWLAGLNAGYNFDFGGFVIGGEADINWTNFGYENAVGGNNVRANLDGFGTARLRAGAPFGPVMPYFTGGLAVARGTVSSTTPAGVTTSQGNTHFGWTLGGGLEAAATENITLRAEFLHVNVGNANYATAPGGASDVGHGFSLIRAGVNYKF